jgi:hypothetical protein
MQIYHINCIYIAIYDFQLFTANTQSVGYYNTNTYIPAPRITAKRTYMTRLTTAEKILNGSLISVIGSLRSDHRKPITVLIIKLYISNHQY